MAGQYFVFAIFLIVISYANAVKVVNGRIKITMGTASGCSNAMRFFNDHLVPTYAEFYDYLEVEFVPWGRTVLHPDGSMTCQFGPNDCWANRLHRCVINKLKGDSMALVRYMSCEFRAPFPSFNQQSYDCVAQTGLDVAEVRFCQENPQLDSLNEDAREAAAEPMRIINWVPFVVFNDEVDLQASRDAHVNFRAMICKALMDDPLVPMRSC